MTDVPDRVRQPQAIAIRNRGVITIPQAIREWPHREIGDNVFVAVQGERIVLYGLDLCGTSVGRVGGAV